MRFLPPQVNQGYLRHITLYIIVENIIYIRDISYICRTYNVHIIMEHYMVKQTSYIYVLYVDHYIYNSGEHYIYIGDIYLRYVEHIYIYI